MLCFLELAVNEQQEIGAQTICYQNTVPGGKIQIPPRGSGCTPSAFAEFVKSSSISQDQFHCGGVGN